MNNVTESTASMPGLWQRISRLGVSKDLHPQAAKRVALFNQLAVTLSAASLPYTLVFVFAGMNFLAYFIPVAVATYLLSLAISVKGHHTVGKLLFILALNATILLYASRFGKDTGIHLMFYASVGLPMILFELRQKLPLALGVASGALCVALFELVSSGSRSHSLDLSQTTTSIMYYTIVPMTFALLFVELFYFYVSNTRAEGSLEQANEEMRLDLMQGGHVQQGLIETVASPNYVLEVCSRPYKGWVGGDGYTFMKSSDDHYWLRVSDGTGHGSSGGEAEIVDHLLFSQAIVDATDSADALKKLSQILAMRFPLAKLTYAYFIARLSPTGHLDYVNARQLAVHIKERAELGPEHVQLKSQAVIVGEPSDVEYLKADELYLAPGDSIFVSTDGIFEAKYWNARAQKFSVIGKKAVAKLAHKPVSDVLHELQTQLPGFEQDDDILMIRIKRKSG